MSHRQARKLEALGVIGAATKSKLKPGAQVEEDPEDDEEEEEEIVVTKQNKNLFAMLGGDDDDNEDEEDEEDGNGRNNDETKKQQQQQQQHKEDGGKKKKKKKNKNKKNKSKANESEDSDEEALKAAISEVSVSGNNNNNNNNSQHQSSDKKDLMLVDMKCLNSDNEMRSLFGSKTVSAENRQARERGGRMMGGGGGAAAHRNVRLKKYYLVSPRDYWPRLSGGLSMEFVGVNEGFHVFKYVRSTLYQDAHRKHIAAVNSMNPQNLADMLMDEPWHVETLLQLAEYSKQMGDHAHADDLTERALYVLESAWPSTFRPDQIRVCLNYDEEENQSLFHALWRQTQSAGRRACHRTAFHLCKLLFMLSAKKDPLGTVLCLDYYAIRAGEYKDLLVMINDGLFGKDAERALPNMAWNKGLALLKLRQEEAGMSDDVSDEAVKVLAVAMVRFPGVFKRMMEATGHAKNSGLKEAMGHRLFAGIDDDDGDDGDERKEMLGNLERIFVERNQLVWKASTLFSFIYRAATMAIKMYESGEYKEFIQPLSGDDITGHQSLYRHAQLSDYSDDIVTLPQDVVNDPFGGNFHRGGAAAVNNNNNDHGVPLDLNLDPLMAFLQSFLPWVANPTHYEPDADVD